MDPQILRKGCLALVDNVRDARAAHADERPALKIALEASNLGLWEWDLATGKLFVDHTYFGFLGLEKDDQIMPIDRARRHSSIPTTCAAFNAATAEAVSGKVPLFQVQHRMRHADGRWVWLETYGSVTQRDRGRPRRCA